MEESNGVEAEKNPKKALSCSDRSTQSWECIIFPLQLSKAIGEYVISIGHIFSRLYQYFLSFVFDGEESVEHGCFFRAIMVCVLRRFPFNYDISLASGQGLNGKSKGYLPHEACIRACVYGALSVVAVVGWIESVRFRLVRVEVGKAGSVWKER